jgi:uroporphyrinogen-III synthase
VIDRRQRDPELHQQAQSLATLLHTITLTAADVPERMGLLLRATSRLLYEKLSDNSVRRETGPDSTRFFNEVSALASSILKELLSPEISSSIAETDRSHIINSCTQILKSLQQQTGSIEKNSFNSSQSSGEELPGSGDLASSQSLRGRVILITRPLSQSQSSVMMVERRGGLPVVVPMIEILDPDDWSPVDHSIANLKEYDGVIFTSQNGVERFLGRMRSINASAIKILATRRVYAVGEKTRTSLENAQIPVTLMPERFSANDLASSLRKEPLAGKRFLFPKGSLAKEEIPAALRACHAKVDEIEVYRTAGATGSTYGALNLALNNGEIDAVAFFSPSAIQNFVHAVELKYTREPIVACIGPSTAVAAESAGFAKIITAPEATAESLVEALARFFA